MRCPVISIHTPRLYCLLLLGEYSLVPFLNPGCLEECPRRCQRTHRIGSDLLRLTFIDGALDRIPRPELIDVPQEFGILWSG
jgi:hypothetical protein